MIRLKNILILFGISLFAYISLSGTIKFNCIFKQLFNISCPSCGLTRSIRALLKFDIIGSFKYNIFGPMIFIIIIVYLIFLVKDIIKNEDKTKIFIYYYLGKYYYIIIICLIISMIINNIRGI